MVQTDRLLAANMIEVIAREMHDLLRNRYESSMSPDGYVAVKLVDDEGKVTGVGITLAEQALRASCRLLERAIIEECGSPECV